MKIKCIEFPNKEFASKRELFRALKKHKDVIIDSKKVARFSDETKINLVEKDGQKLKQLEIKENHSVHVINTTKLLDSHNDLHIDGIWNKTIKDRKGKIYFLADHQMKLDSVIAYPKDVKMKLVTISWKDLGYDYEGETQALIFEINRDAVRHKEAQFIIDSNMEIEHSVRMSYVRIDLALNSDDEDDKTEKKLWDKYYPEVANKDDADERGYMWVVREAKIVQEGSMVLRGSNFATPMRKHDDIDLGNEESEEEKRKDESTKDKTYPFLV